MGGCIFNNNHSKKGESEKIQDKTRNKIRSTIFNSPSMALNS